MFASKKDIPEKVFELQDEDEVKLTRKQIREEKKAIKIMAKEEKKQKKDENYILDEQRELISKANQESIEKKKILKIKKTNGKSEQDLKELEEFLGQEE